MRMRGVGYPYETVRGHPRLFIALLFGVMVGFFLPPLHSSHDAAADRLERRHVALFHPLRHHVLQRDHASRCAAAPATATRGGFSFWF